MISLRLVGPASGFLPNPLLRGRTVDHCFGHPRDLGPSLTVLTVFMSVGIGIPPSFIIWVLMSLTRFPWFWLVLWSDLVGDLEVGLLGLSPGLSRDFSYDKCCWGLLKTWSCRLRSLWVAGSRTSSDRQRALWVSSWSHAGEEEW
jgi:hypothetical protein